MFLLLIKFQSQWCYNVTIRDFLHTFSRYSSGSSL